MVGLILVGDNDSFDNYISEFQKKEGIDNIATSIYAEKILIENTRTIIKSLSLKSYGKRLFVLKSDITIEAQNALLKNLEELEANTSFIICTQSLRNLLPTIHSRCLIVNLGKNQLESNSNISNLVNKYLTNQIKLWELVDRIEESELFKNDVGALLSGLRELLLVTDSKNKVFVFCKRTIRYSSLIEKNNINSRIALERIFSI